MLYCQVSNIQTCPLDIHGAAVPEVHPRLSYLTNNLNKFFTQKSQSLFFLNLHKTGYQISIPVILVAIAIHIKPNRYAKNCAAKATTYFFMPSFLTKPLKFCVVKR